MAKQFSKLDEGLVNFIEAQHIFFVASAAPGARVNVSPRSTECLRVLDATSVCYLDRTGSGNETAAHLKADGRMTLMLCAVAGPPRILRLYGRGQTHWRGSDEYARLLQTNYGGEEPLNARQIVVLDIDLVQTSCGFGVPLFAFEGERESMDRWAAKKLEDGPEQLEAYQRENNQVSIDGLPTGMFD